MSNVQVNIRDQNIKKKSQQIFKKLGMDMTTAVNMFLVQVVQENGLPFSARLTDGLTTNGLTPEEEQEILQASEEAKQGKNVTYTKTWQETKSHLDSLK